MTDNDSRARGGLVGGLILIAIGVAAFAMQFYNVGGGAIVAALGAAFLVAFAVTRNYGMLVPGGILAGLGCGIIAQQTGAADGVVVLGLGIGFLFIWVLDLLTGGGRSQGRWWPLIPGGILIVVGIGTALPGFERYLVYVWPVVLIVIGALLIARAFSKSDSQPPTNDN